MKKYRIFVANTILFAGLSAFSINAQAVNLTGTVKDNSTQIGIANATVSLIAEPLISAKTDANGNYSLSGSQVKFLRSINAVQFKTPYSHQSRIFFGISKSEEPVQIDLFDLCGKHISSIVNTRLSKGTYQVNPFKEPLAGQLYFAKVQISEKTYTLRIPYAKNASESAIDFVGNEKNNRFGSGLIKAVAINDTLMVSALGYATVRKAITAYVGTNNFLLTAKAGSEGSISFENGSYQGCQNPIVVTVTDSDLVAATVLIKVKSTSDGKGFTMPLRKVTSSAGTYSDTVFLSIVKSDSVKHLIKVLDGDVVSAYYSDATPLQLDSTEVSWSGTPGNVQPGLSPYKGVLKKMTVNLWDADVADSFVTVTVASDKDNVGIITKLRQVVGSFGSYTGQIRFSLKASQGDSVLAVMGTTNDNILIKYHDLTPAKDIIGSTCVWEPYLAAITMDSTAYHGVASKMSIKLIDDDITDSTAIVTVKSKVNPVGIKDTLKAVAGSIRYFSGSVGFSTAVSGANNIAVQDNDTLTVQYQDDSPVQAVSQKVPWNLH